MYPRWHGDAGLSGGAKKISAKTFTEGLHTGCASGLLRVLDHDDESQMNIQASTLCLHVVKSVWDIGGDI